MKSVAEDSDKHKRQVERGHRAAKSLIPADIAKAVVKAWTIGLSYALYMLPRQNECYFQASFNPPGSTNSLTPAEFDSFSGFVFNMFELSDTLHAYGIYPELSAEDVLNLEPENIPEQRKSRAIFSFASTQPMVYKAQARKIIAGFTSDDEKTVLSRIFCQPSEKADPVSVANEYFALHPGCFRYLYYTPESGTWIGASPELIITYDATSGELGSMSLAGTRLKNTPGEWDAKNCMEHNMVTDFIVNTLSLFCTHVDQPRSRSVDFGPVEHLCHTISAHGNLKLSEVLPRLTPTPALCGFPREKAYNQIIETEAHRRMCYGGFVGLKSTEHTCLFANLRSAMVNINQGNPFIDKYCYNLFGGGGLTRYSDPDNEYNETYVKMYSLLNIIESIS